jgi:peptidoglycan hydrolase-like protein with peptidoglycan-binding domain
VPTATIPAPAAAPTPPARPSAAVVADIQRELSRRGFYDGVVDGRYGPRTDASIRDFEQAAGLKPSTAPDEALLRAIQRSTVRSKAGLRPPAPIPQAKPDPIADMIAPSKQVVAVQRALSEFGYGQIKPTGIVDPETQSAIQKFERERKLPVTGQLSHRVVRELASITGRPLE